MSLLEVVNNKIVKLKGVNTGVLKYDKVKHSFILCKSFYSAKVYKEYNLSGYHIVNFNSFKLLVIDMLKSFGENPREFNISNEVFKFLYCSTDFIFHMHNDKYYDLQFTCIDKFEVFRTGNDLIIFYYNKFVFKDYCVIQSITDMAQTIVLACATVLYDSGKLEDAIHFLHNEKISSKLLSKLTNLY